jgi:hypothetical protein
VVIFFAGAESIATTSNSVRRPRLCTTLLPVECSFFVDIAIDGGHAHGPCSCSSVVLPDSSFLFIFGNNLLPKKFT